MPLPNDIYNGDCLEVMKDIRDESIDLILTDLPYGSTKCSWDVVIPFDKLWLQYKRIIKPNGAILLFGNEPFASTLRLSNVKWYRYDWYWQKERPTNILQLKRRPGKVIETISCFYQNQCLFNPIKTLHDGKIRTNKIKNGKLGKLIDNQVKKVIAYRDDTTRYPLQIQKFNRDCLKTNLHPTQKPVALCEYLIKTYTNVNEIVLDSCCGSGSTCVAAQNLNRNYIGIDSSVEYCQIAKDRLCPI